MTVATELEALVFSEKWQRADMATMDALFTTMLRQGLIKRRIYDVPPLTVLGIKGPVQLTLSPGAFR